MYILGVYSGHNSTAVIMKDGKILAAASEERFNCVKNSVGFPKQAIGYVLKEAKVRIENVHCITISHTTSVPSNFKILKLNGRLPLSIKLLSIISYPICLLRLVWGYLEWYFPDLRKISRIFSSVAFQVIGKYSNNRERESLAKTLMVDYKKIRAFDHHLSHAASAYYSSPYNKKKALVLTLDGEGDMLSGSVNIFEGAQYTTLAKIPRDNSLGYLYGHVTGFLGMKPNEHEYKVMGLAPYAKGEAVGNLYKRIESVVKIDTENLLIYTSYNTLSFTRFLRKYMQGVRFDLIAAVFQKLLEDKITLWVRSCVEKTGISTVLLAGGVFMNVKVNQKVSELSEVKEFFIAPSCSDESSIIGSSYLAFIEEFESKKKPFSIPPIENIYWGPKFSNKEIEVILREYKGNEHFTFKKFKLIEKEIAVLLAQGKVVARLAGRMEFGARALGNRSILADPRSFDTVRVINEQIKNRDFWMPFAPSVLAERQDDYIKNPKKISSYYMMLSFDTLDKARIDLKAAIHPYDFTARPQIVSEKHNQKYYKILKEFEKLTNVGGVLNTSFNLHGYPIVLGPKQAIDVFLKSGITHLALENFLLVKSSSSSL